MKRKTSVSEQLSGNVKGVQTIQKNNTLRRRVAPLYYKQYLIIKITNKFYINF